MLYLLIKNELKVLFREGLLFGLTFVVVVLSTYSILFSSYQTQQYDLQQKQVSQHIRHQWESITEMNPHRAAHYGTYVFKPIYTMGILDDGIDQTIGRVIRLEAHVQNEMAYSQASQMQFVSKFGKFKIALILKYILPLFLIFLSFQLVGTERQTRCLKLLLSQGVKPMSFVFSKVLAILSYAVCLLLFLMLVFSILNIDILSFDLCLRVLLFFLVYTVYYAIIISLTVLLSLYFKNITTVLVSMLCIWIFWSIIFPNLTMTYLDTLYPLPSRNTFVNAMKEDRSKGIRAQFFR